MTGGSRKTLSPLLPRGGRGLEVGVGIDPAAAMLTRAKRRGIAVCRALGERLPFRDDRFDFALLVTVLCFARDVPALLREACRVLRPAGTLVAGFIDKNSPLGRSYDRRKREGRFYGDAVFHEPLEVIELIQCAGFRPSASRQTLFGLPGENPSACEVREGWGEGSFVAIAAKTPPMERGEAGSSATRV